MEDLEQKVQDKLRGIKEAGGFVTIPKEYTMSCEEKSRWSYYNIPRGVPIKAEVSTYEKYHGEKEGQLYLTLYGDFGTNDEGYPIGEIYDPSDEDILALQLPEESTLSAIEESDRLEALIQDAVKAYETHAEENGLGRYCEYSTDPHTISEWNSSRC